MGTKAAEFPVRPPPVAGAGGAAAGNWVRVRGTIQVYDILGLVYLHMYMYMCMSTGGSWSCCGGCRTECSEQRPTPRCDEMTRLTGAREVGTCVNLFGTFFFFFDERTPTPGASLALAQ